MKTAQNQPKKRKGTAEKAAVPVTGAAAFSISTAFRPIPDAAPFPAIFQHRRAKHAAAHNLLPQKHYFRPSLAEGPIATVVLTEGQKNPLGKLREVAV